MYRIPDFAWSNGDPTSTAFHFRSLLSAGGSAPEAAVVSLRDDACWGRPQLTARPSNDPPTVSVAEVRITVDSPNNRDLSRPPTDSGAIRTARRTLPRNSSAASHTTS